MCCCLFYYFQVETRYHQTYTFLVNSVNLRKDELKSSDAAFQLIDEIERHVVETKESQFRDLRRLAQLSQDVFGDDKTQKILDDNVFIYQSFEKVKSDIVELVRDFKEKEDAVRRSRSVDIERNNVLVIESSEDYSTEEHVHDIVPVVEHTVPPKFLNYLESSEVREGENFIFECQVIGQPSPDIKWLKYNSQMFDNQNCRISYENGNCRLELFNLSSNDAAVFSCVATNSVGTSQTTANLIVIEEPKQKFTSPSFIRNLQNGYANENSSFEFNCLVEGSPLPSVQWFKNDICVDNYPSYNITYNNGAASLSIPCVNLTDQGVFSARATNEAGFIECSGILSVEGENLSYENFHFINDNYIFTAVEKRQKPIIKSPLSDVATHVGEKFTLQCEVDGDPQPDVFWTFNGKIIDDVNVSYFHNSVIFFVCFQTFLILNDP